TEMQTVFWPHLKLRGGDFGNAILVRGKAEPVAMYRLPGRVLQLRAMLEARVEVDGISLDFFCTHLVHFGPLMARSRGRQFAEVARRVADRRHLRVLVGDMNSRWGRLDADSLARAGLFPIAVHEPRSYPAHRPRFSFDHIFASQEWACRGL